LTSAPPSFVATPERTQGWESIWAGLDALPIYWRTPELAVVAWAKRLWQAGVRQVLDLGCGLGRHAVMLARAGFAVTASDVSPSGLATCAAWLAREGLSATTVLHEMATLPFPDRFFDGLVGYNVIYHTTVAGMRRILAEIGRVLRPDGRLYVTIIARSDSRVNGYRADVATTKCQEIEPFTFIYQRDAPGDKYLPHHYSDKAELDAFMAGFVVDDTSLMHVEYIDEDGVVQTGAHYHVRARRL